MIAKPSRLFVIACQTLLLVVCLGSAAGAQTRLGATGALNWSNLKGDGPEDALFGRALGYGAGIVADVPLSRQVSLSVQPMIVRRGTDVSFDVGEEEPRDSLEVRLDYIDCLVMVKVFAENDVAYVSGGAGLGFLTNAAVKDVRTDEEEDIKGLFQDVDLTLALGVGVMVPAGGTVLTFEFRYQQSVLSISDPDAIPEGEGLAPRMRSSGFQLLAAVLFPRGGD